VNREREAQLEAGLPEAMDTDDWRRLLMARDREGYLQRAQVAALQGVAVARTPKETYQALLVLAQMDHDAGQHAAELRQALRLMTLAPRNPDALEVLRRAARCNGRGALARQADSALAVLGVLLRIKCPASPFPWVERLSEHPIYGEQHPNTSHTARADHPRDQPVSSEPRRVAPPLKGLPHKSSTQR
jgi:hypothetical protein